MPYSVWMQGCTTVDQTVYLIGGGWKQTLRSSWAYHPETGIWEERAPMPVPRGYGVGVCSLDGKIYAIGGWDGVNPEGGNRNDMYDPESDSWTEMAPMQVTRIGPAVVVSDGKIYAIGGTANPASAHNTIEVYDPVKDEWHFAAPMQHERFGVVAAVGGNRIIAFGGTNSNRNPSAGFVEVYDPETDQWMTLEDITARSQWGAACSDGSTIYILGGEDRCAMTYPDEAAILNTFFSFSFPGKAP